jgi:YggT family protein
MVIAAELIDIALQLFALLIFARVIISWVRIDPYHPLVQFLYNVTEPVLAPIRRLMPGGMMLDFSPMIALVVIFALRQLLITLLA